jgi:putative transcriptional regulator
MKKGNITRFKLSPKKPPKSDWRAFDTMSEEQRRRAALSDPDAPPATAEHLARARRIPSVRALRKKLKLTQEQCASRFHLPLGTLRDWEQGAHRPDKAAQILLRIVARDPDAVVCALKNSPNLSGSREKVNKINGHPPKASTTPAGPQRPPALPPAG